MSCIGIIIIVHIITRCSNMWWVNSLLSCTFLREGASNEQLLLTELLQIFYFIKH
jgi:hypothetical protein